MPKKQRSKSSTSDAHDALYQRAYGAIHDVHNDVSVPVSTTRCSLQALRDEIDILLDAMKSSR